MGGVFGGGGGGGTTVVREPAAPVEPPKKDDEGVKDAATKERQRRARARGRSSTILTGGLGAPDEGSVRRASLLSGG